MRDFGSLTYTDELVPLRVSDLIRSEDVPQDWYDGSKSRRAIDDAGNSHGVPTSHESRRREGEKGYLEQQLQPNQRREPGCGRLGHEVVVVGFDMELSRETPAAERESTAAIDATRRRQSIDSSEALDVFMALPRATADRSRKTYLNVPHT